MEKIRNMDRNWKFYRGDLEPHTRTSDWGGATARGFQTGATARGLDDSGWRSVDLPHDFVVEGDYTNLTHHEKQMTNIPEMESIDSRHFASGCLEGGIATTRLFSCGASGMKKFFHRTDRRQQRRPGR
ncbi:MAG: hypothetical protein LUH00_06675 [Lachnospiraceae bacterium]|nr:hypothetical protein [Lachnospiraceae bacterium]